MYSPFVKKYRFKSIFIYKISNKIFYLTLIFVKLDISSISKKVLNILSCSRSALFDGLIRIFYLCPIVTNNSENKAKKVLCEMQKKQLVKEKPCLLSLI